MNISFETLARVLTEEGIGAMVNGLGVLEILTPLDVVEVNLADALGYYSVDGAYGYHQNLWWTLRTAVQVGSWLSEVKHQRLDALERVKTHFINMEAV